MKKYIRKQRKNRKDRNTYLSVISGKNGIPVLLCNNQEVKNTYVLEVRKDFRGYTECRVTVEAAIVADVFR